MGAEQGFHSILDNEHTVVAIETLILEDQVPNLLLLRLHTDSGLIGHMVKPITFLMP